MNQERDDRFTPADAEIVKRKARNMFGQHGWNRQDVEDIEAELIFHIWKQSPRHDPAQGPRERFIKKITKNKMLNLIEARKAKKRDGRRNVLLDDAIEGAVLDGRNDPAKIDTQIAVRAVIAQLTPELRQVALLRQEHSERDLEKLLNLTRAQVRTRIHQLANIFRNSGLAPDSDNHSPTEPGSDLQSPIHDSGDRSCKPQSPVSHSATPFPWPKSRRRCVCRCWPSPACSVTTECEVKSASPSIAKSDF